MLNSIFYNVTFLKYGEYYQGLSSRGIPTFSLFSKLTSITQDSSSHFLDEVFSPRPHEVPLFMPPWSSFQDRYYNTLSNCTMLFIYWAICLTRLSAPSLHYSLHRYQTIAQGHIHCRPMVNQFLNKKIHIICTALEKFG